MKHRYLLLLLSALALWPYGAARAQATSGGSPLVGWLKLSSELPLRGSWQVYSEIETRQASTHLTAQQLGRVGLRWHPLPGFSLTTGYVLAYNGTLPDAHFARLPEHRLYQEVALAETSGRLRVNHRLRAEERWLRASYESPFAFAPRVRYQLRMVLPLRPEGRLPVGAPYLLVADELFAGLGAREGRSLLEENRASAGLGYRLTSALSLELAYLHQAQTATAQANSWTRNALQLSAAYAPSRPQGLVRR